jgi:uncharacterized protein YigA (DUF484 family)
MSNSKIGIIGALLAAVVAITVAVQYRSIARLREENQALSQQADQIASLQAENERLSNAVVTAAAAPEANAPARELARLRSEVAALRQSVSQLRQQTNRIASLQQENQRLQSSLSAMETAKPAPPPAVDQAAQDQNACINNLRQIDSAKQQWALEQHKQPTDIPAWTDLQPYLGRGPNGDLPACPSGGTYTIGAVSEKPQCSAPNHVLP